MTTATEEYDAKLDSKRRITLRGAHFDYYHVVQHEDGTITLEPRELVAPFTVSRNTLAMMDESIRNMDAGQVSDEVDLSEF